MLTVLRKSFYTLVLLFSPSVAVAQVATGSYPYGTFDSPGIDTINVGNLNVHLAFQLLNKAGRGLPFVYGMSYDNSAWMPVSSSGAMLWQPVTNWGWRGSTEAATGYATENVISSACAWTSPPGPRIPIGFRTTKYNVVYHDAWGVAHPFAGSSFNQPSSCGSPTSGDTIGPLATDGSGYQYSGLGDGEVTARNGTVLATPSTFVPTGAATVTDTNGNQISVNNSGQFTDTTGNIALTVAGAAPPSSETFTYTDTTGTSRIVSLNYTTYTVQTAFGCSGIGEYGPTSTPLVSSMTFPDGSEYQFTYEQTPGLPGNVTGRLASVVLPQGGTIEYSYTGGNYGIECADGSTAGLTRTLAASQSSAASIWTYSRTITGTGASQTAVVDGLGNHKTYTFVEASNQPTPTTAVYYETSRTIDEGVSTTVLARNTCYNYNGTSSPCTTTAFSLPIDQIDTYETLDGIETHGATAKFNAYGAEAESDIYDFGASARGTLLRKEIWTYGYSIPVLPTEDMVVDGSGNEAGNTSFGYDAGTPITSSAPQHVAVSGPRGNLTSESIYASSGTSYALSSTYEDTGSVLTSVAPTGTTTLSYDSSFVYNKGAALPTPSSGVAVGTGESYDTTYTGFPLTLTDPNGQVTTISSYNSMLRPTVINYPDGGNTVITYNSYGDANQIGISIAQNASTSTNTQILYDSYGRQGRVALFNGQSGDSWYQKDSCYDGNGNLQFSSYAYKGSGFSGANQNPVCSGSGGDTYTYDVLGRLKTVTRGDGEARSYTYLGRATKSVDENSVTRISQVDGLGRTTVVCEISSNSSMPSSGAPVTCPTDITGATGFTTTYSYALATGTTTVTQGAQTRTFQTDWLGRTTSVTEPESGTTTYSYAYNATGLVVTRKRPKANQSTHTVLTTTTTQYDSLGRVVTITYDDNLTPNKTYVYDQNYPGGWAGQNGTNLIGRLAYLGAIVGSNNATHTGQLFSYDPMGRVVGMWECGPSTCGTANQATRPLSYTYDLAGNMKTSTDGGGVTSTYTVSIANELQSLTSSVSNTMNPAAIISNVQNGPNGPISFNLGNGLTGVNGYDGLGRSYGAWVCNASSVPTCTGGTQIHGEAVALSGNRPTAECDTVLNQCMNYGYDEFNRLASRTVTSGPVQNFAYTYDLYGNRWSQTLTAGSGTWPQPSYSFNTNNQITNTGFAYDAAGNMTNDGVHSYSYDADGNILSVDSSSTATYLYNALNQRVRTVVGSTITDFTFNAAGQRVSMWNGTTGAQIQGQYYWGSKPVAFYKSSATHFQHQDRLGSERVRTTYNGAVEGSFTFLPFGDAQTTYSGTDLDPYHYAQLDYDSETNSSHAQYRQYNSTQGRWMRPDPYYGSYSFDDPQSFNRYIYAANNPLTYVDPSGLQVICYMAPDTANADGSYGVTSGGYLCVDDGSGNGGGGGNSGNGGGGGGGNTGSDVKAVSCIPLTPAGQAVVNALGTAASFTNHTIGVGLGVSAGAGYGIGGLNFSVSLQIVASPDGTSGLAFSYIRPTAQGMAGIASEGAGAIGGAQFSASTVGTVSDLAGPGVNAGAFLADGPGVGFDTTFGIADGGLTQQINLTLGFGAGGDGHGAAVTSTFVVPFCP